MPIRRYFTILNVESEVFGYFYKLAFWDITRPDDKIDNIYVKKVKVLESNDPKLYGVKEIYIEHTNLVHACQNMRHVYSSFWTGKEVYYGRGYLIKSFGNIYRIFPEVSPVSTYRIFVDIGYSSVDVVYVPNIHDPKYIIPIYSTGELKDLAGRICVIRFDGSRIERFTLLNLKQDVHGVKPLPINLEVVSGRLVRSGEEAEIPILKYVPGYYREIIESIERGARAITYFELYNIPVTEPDVHDLLAGARYYREWVEKLVNRFEKLRDYLHSMYIRTQHLEIGRTLRIIDEIFKEIEEEIDLKPILERIKRKGTS